MPKVINHFIGFCHELRIMISNFLLYEIKNSYEVAYLSAFNLCNKIVYNFELAGRLSSSLPIFTADREGISVLQRADIFVER